MRAQQSCVVLPCRQCFSPLPLVDFPPSPATRKLPRGGRKAYLHILDSTKTEWRQSIISSCWTFGVNRVWGWAWKGACGRDAAEHWSSVNYSQTDWWPLWPGCNVGVELAQNIKSLCITWKKCERVTISSSLASSQHPANLHREHILVLMGDMRHIRQTMVISWSWLLKNTLPCAVHSDSKTFLCSGWLMGDYHSEGTSGRVDYTVLMSE